MRAFLIFSALALAGCKTPEPKMQVQHVIVPAPGEVRRSKSDPEGAAACRFPVQRRR